MFENRVLRRIFGPKRDEVTGNGGNCVMSLMICAPYKYLMIKSRRMGLSGYVARMGGKRDTYTGFWWVDLRTMPLERPRRRWKDIKFDKEVDGAGHELDL
jgi:hypothetical protein